MPTHACFASISQTIQHPKNLSCLLWIRFRLNPKSLFNRPPLSLNRSSLNHKRIMRKKKTSSKIGDLVQLEKCKPISKKKTFLEIPVPKRNAPKEKQEESQEIGLALESDSSSQA